MNGWLLAGGAASGAAAIAHLLCVAGGARCYRALGAGERMARAVEGGKRGPHLLTLGIATMLGLWAAYAWSGAGLIRPLPLLRPMLVVIAGIYLLRALALPLLFRIMPDRSRAFLVWSSLVVLAMGTLHAIGLRGIA